MTGKMTFWNHLGAIQIQFKRKIRKPQLNAAKRSVGLPSPDSQGMTKRTAGGDLSSLGFQLYINLSGTSFLTRIVVNMNYILQEENFKYFKELAFSRSQAVAK